MKVLKSFVKSKLFSTAGNIVRDEKGNFAIIGAVTAALLVAGLSLAIDISNGFSARQTLQDTTDAIALAAARSEVSDIAGLNDFAQEYLTLKYPGQSGATVNLESITRDGDVVNVVASQTQTTYFAGIFGLSGLDVKVVSSAEYASRDLNLTLVLDSTGSMRGAKLANLKAACNDLIELLSNNIPTDKLNMGVVPFAQHVNVGTNMSNQSWIDFPQTGGFAPNDWNGCVGSRPAPLNTRIVSQAADIPGIVGANCATPIQPLTSNINRVRQSINGLQAGGWTYMPAGIAWGWRTMTPQAPFTETRGQDATKTDNVMVVMTDGANTRSFNGLAHNGTSQRDADQTTAEICENAKRDNITVYTIAYEVNDAGTQNLLESCASDSEYFFNASNASQLRAAFNEIALSLGTSRITS